MNRYTGKVYEDPDNPDEYVILLPHEMLDAVGWKIGDELNWIEEENGNIVLTKSENKQDLSWVLVEAISTHRTRYMVQVPTSNPKWALDSVAMEDAKEFSQEWLGEQIVSHRVVSEVEAMELFNEDNSAYAFWDDEKKQKTFFTFWDDIKNND